MSDSKALFEFKTLITRIYVTFGFFVLLEPNKLRKFPYLLFSSGNTSSFSDHEAIGATLKIVRKKNRWGQLGRSGCQHKR